MKFLQRLLLAIILVTAVAACAPADTETENPLENTGWTLKAFGPAGAEVPIIEESNITLTFGPDEQASGFGGCNNFTTSYEVLNGSIEFGDIASTLVACDLETFTDQEDKYLSALRSAEEFELMDDGLVIRYADVDGEGHLNFTAADAG